MKKNTVIILSALLAIVAVSCASHSTEPASQDPKTQEPGTAVEETKQSGNAETAVYICPMHPEVTSDKEGTCPKCGMQLEVKK